MTADREPVRKADRFDDSPIAWFGELFLARERGDFRRASEAQSELARLGWTVRFRQPRRPEGGGN